MLSFSQFLTEKTDDTFKEKVERLARRSRIPQVDILKRFKKEIDDGGYKATTIYAWIDKARARHSERIEQIKPRKKSKKYVIPKTKESRAINKGKAGDDK